MNNRQPTTFLQKIFLLISSIAFFLVLLEMGLRVGGYAVILFQDAGNRPAMRSDEGYRILCVGDSMTAFGGKDSYPFLLEEELNQNDTGITFRVMNKGRIGADSATVVSQLAENIELTQPNMVIAMVGINDTLQTPKYQPDKKFAQRNFVTNFRVYKLGKLLWAHAADKLSKSDIVMLFSPRFCHAAETKPDETETRLKESIAKDPQNSSAYYYLGKYYRQYGKMPEAEKMFKKALELKPGDFLASCELGWCYHASGRHNEALEIFIAALKRESDNPLAYYQLGCYFMANKKYAEAERVFKLGMVKIPDDYMLHVWLASYYRDVGRYAEAETMYKKSMKLNPHMGMRGLAVSYLVQGNAELAEKYFEEINKVDMEHYHDATKHNFKQLEKILRDKGIVFVCVQYPIRSIRPLRALFRGSDGIVFVDNEKIFKEALKGQSFRKYFSDVFASDFGHCTREGNMLLARNIANAVIAHLKGQ